MKDKIRLQIMRNLKRTAPIKLLIFLYRYIRFCVYARKARKIRNQNKVENLIKDYQKLIDEYQLIQEKKSKLSRRQRDMVEFRIMYLIRKGHIVINQNTTEV